MRVSQLLAVHIYFASVVYKISMNTTGSYYYGERPRHLPIMLHNSAHAAVLPFRCWHELNSPIVRFTVDEY